MADTDRCGRGPERLLTLPMYSSELCIVAPPGCPPAAAATRIGAGAFYTYLQFLKELHQGVRRALHAAVQLRIEFLETP